MGLTSLGSLGIYPKTIAVTLHLHMVAIRRTLNPRLGSRRGLPNPPKGPFELRQMSYVLDS